MSCLVLDPAAMLANLQAVDGLVRAHGAGWTLVTKALSGWQEALRLVADMGVRSIADSRLENLDCLDDCPHPMECWYLRPPGPSNLERVVATTRVSLNTDIGVVEAMDAAAAARGVRHSIVVMVELGDLREGVNPSSLAEFFRRSKNLSCIDVVGMGSNLGCLSGAVPTLDQLSRLVLYRELMELKFGVRLPYVSAGTSAVLPMLPFGNVPAGVNHFRVGEAVLLGTDLIHGGIMEGLRDDVFTYRAEILEIGEKSSLPFGEVSEMSPFEHLDAGTGGAQGLAHEIRAVIGVGQLDTNVQGLTCTEKDCHIVGASSDLAVVSLGGDDRGFKVGDWLEFIPSYGALVRLAESRYVDRVLAPWTGQGRVSVPPFLAGPAAG